MPKREKTKYPGVFYRESKRVGGPGMERIYYIVFKKEGRVIEEKAGRQFADDMTPAKAARIRAERIEGKRQSRKEIRVAKKAEKQAAAERWTLDRLWNAYKTVKLMKGIITEESRYRKHLQPRFGEKEPSEIVPFDVDKLRVTLLKTHSPQTVKHVLVLLRRIVNFGVKKNLCEGLSFKIDIPKVRNEKTEDLTQEQLTALLKAIDEDSNITAGDMMKMALFSGMRRGELFRLRWMDVDFGRGFITIRDPKGGYNQKIPLNDAARSVLLSRERNKSEFVFPGRAGKQRVEIKLQVDRIKKKAGLPDDFRPLHGLRHVFASMLASSGQVDMYVLQKLLTHKTPSMTMRYAHLRDEALKQASNLAGAIVEKAIKENGEKNKKVIPMKGEAKNDD